MEQSVISLGEPEKMALISAADEHLLSSYFVQRINQKIHPQSIINIINSLAHLDGQILIVDGQLNEIIIWKFFNHEYPEYLLYCLGKDNRQVRPLVRDLISHLVQNVSTSEVISTIEMIDEYSHCDKELLYFEVMNSYSSNTREIRRLMIIDAMDEKTKYKLLVRALLEGRFYFIRDIEKYLTNEKFYKYIQSRLNDEDDLAVAIRNSLISIDHLIDNKLFRECIFGVAERLSQTIKFMFEIARDQRRGDILIKFAQVYDKREILKALTKLDNSTIFIDKLFSLYKNNSDIKNLAPFI